MGMSICGLPVALKPLTSLENAHHSTLRRTNMSRISYCLGWGIHFTFPSFLSTMTWEWRCCVFAHIGPAILNFKVVVSWCEICNLKIVKSGTTEKIRKFAVTSDHSQRIITCYFARAYEQFPNWRLTLFALADCILKIQDGHSVPVLFFSSFNFFFNEWSAKSKNPVMADCFPPRGPRCPFRHWMRVTRTLGTRLSYTKMYPKYCFLTIAPGYYDNTICIEDTIARPTFPTGVWTGGTIWLPGIQVSLSFSLGPSLTSISNRCALRYTATMEPLSSTTTWELRSLLSSGGPCIFCTRKNLKRKQWFHSLCWQVHVHVAHDQMRQGYR